MDDFNCSGKESFHKEVTEEIQKKLTFGKKEETSFRFTGLDFLEKDDEMLVKQNQYCESLKEIEIKDKVNTESELIRDEYKSFRGVTGKLFWLQEQTRPDLSYNSLQMSMKNKNSTVADINKINKIVRIVRKAKSLIKFSKIDKFENSR